jgi:hypothetical protein
MHIINSHKTYSYIQMIGFQCFDFLLKKFPKGKIWI